MRRKLGYGFIALAITIIFSVLGMNTSWFAAAILASICGCIVLGLYLLNGE